MVDLVGTGKEKKLKIQGGGVAIYLIDSFLS